MNTTGASKPYVTEDGDQWCCETCYRLAAQTVEGSPS